MRIQCVAFLGEVRTHPALANPGAAVFADIETRRSRRRIARHSGGSAIDRLRFCYAFSHDVPVHSIGAHTRSAPITDGETRGNWLTIAQVDSSGLGCRSEPRHGQYRSGVTMSFSASQASTDLTIERQGLSKLRDSTRLDGCEISGKIELDGEIRP